VVHALFGKVTEMGVVNARCSITGDEFKVQGQMAFDEDAEFELIGSLHNTIGQDQYFRLICKPQ
jgi:hypothetical protein